MAIPVFYSFHPNPDQDWVKPVSVGILLLSVVLLQGWSRDPLILFSGNPAAWTLAVEAFFYALHPLFNRGISLLQRRGATVVIVLAFILAVVYRIAVILLPGSFLAELPVPLVRLNEFVIGMGLARVMLFGARVPIPPVMSYLLLAGFVFWQVIGARNNFDDGVLVWSRHLSEEILVGIFSIMILAVATRDARGRRSLLRSRPLLHLGAWSFAFYLLHATVMYAVMGVLGKQSMSFSNLWWYLSVGAVSILLSWGLYNFVERPLEKRMRRWGDANLR